MYSRCLNVLSEYKVIKMYSQPVSQYARTWYKPAPRTVEELRFSAGQHLINMYDTACDKDDLHLIGLFDNELGYMSQAAQLADGINHIR